MKDDIEIQNAVGLQSVFDWPWYLFGSDKVYNSRFARVVFKLGDILCCMLRTEAADACWLLIEGVAKKMETINFIDKSIAATLRHPFPHFLLTNG